VVARGLHIMGDHVRQPEVVVRGAAPKPEPGFPFPRLMPPLQDITFSKLLVRVEQYLAAAGFRINKQKGQNILNLITKPVSAAPPAARFIKKTISEEFAVTETSSREIPRSGMPPSRAQIAATAAAFSFVTWNPGRTAVARAMNSSTDS